MIALGPAVLAVVAQAAPVDVELCGWYQLTFADNHDPGAGFSVGDDFFADVQAVVPSLKPARGALIEVREADGSGLPVVARHAAWNGPDAGCVAVRLDTERAYDVRLWSEASVRGNTISVRDPDTDELWYATVLEGWTPTAVERGRALRVDVDTATHDVWRLAAVLGWALKRRAGGLTGATIDAYPAGCTPPKQPEGSGGCAWIGRGADGERLVLYNDRPDWKYRTAHELGHGLQMLASGEPSYSRRADPGECYAIRPDGARWEYHSTEYQSLANVEGIADFYAALVFNKDVTESDCYLHTRNPVDWDLDGAPDTTFPSCHATPDSVGSLPGSVDEADYLGDRCGGGENRATVYDQIRFYWHLRADPEQGPRPTLGELYAIWRAADPTTWNATDRGQRGADPARRLGSAAELLGWGAVWQPLSVEHGTHR